MKIPEDKVEEIRAANDIVSVVQGYVTLKKRGHNWLGLCPFHSEKTPSFNVNPQRQIFKCFGCGKGGNAFSFVAEMEKVSYGEAIRLLAERVGIAVPKWRPSEGDEPTEGELLAQANGLARDFFYRQLVDSDSDGAREARDYFAKRGYGREVIDAYLLGYAPDSWDALADFARRQGVALNILVKSGLLKEGKEAGRPYDAFRHRVMFPIRNLAGRVIAFGGRRLRDHTDSAPPATPPLKGGGVGLEAKYINSPESVLYTKGREVFGLWEARNEIRRRDRAILVEGYTDCLSLVKAGVSVAVASLGTSLTAEQAKLVMRFTPNVHIFYDGDSAGLSAAKRAVDILLAVGAAPRVVISPPEDDPDTFVQKYGAEEVWALMNRALPPVEFQLELAARTNAPMRDTVRELVQTSTAIAGPVDRELFLQQVSARTGISADTLHREIARIRTEPRTTAGPPAARAAGWPPRGPLATLTRILVAQPELRSEVFERWTPRDVPDPKLAAILAAMWEEWQTGVMREAETILDRFNDSETRDFLSECLMTAPGDDDDDQNLKKYNIDRHTAMDCLTDFESAKIKLEIATVKAAMAAGSGDEGELQLKMQGLARKHKELLAKKRS